MSSAFAKVTLVMLILDFLYKMYKKEDTFIDPFSKQTVSGIQGLSILQLSEREISLKCNSYHEIFPSIINFNAKYVNSGISIHRNFS